ncbi:MAG TPA: DMT family transporter [Symbiobacteriaceae bacterium]|nr:DMT family transporter [Symbiobacteriaceae bacterium]
MARGYLSIIASMLIWGSVGIFVRMAGTEPLVSVTFRVLFAAIAMGGLAFLQPKAGSGAPVKGPGTWRRRALLLASGLGLALNWLFFFKALDTTSVTNAVLAYYAAPVLVAVSSPLLLGERLERRTLVAMAMAFGGICVMLYQPQSLRAADILGIGYGLIAACFYASVTITGRWLADVPPARLVLIQCATASLVLVPAVLLSAGAGALAVPAGALLMLAVIGVVHTALALFLYFGGLRTVKVQHVGVLAYLDPVSAVLFAYLFLGEVPTGASLAGGALVLGGSALLLGRKAS